MASPTANERLGLLALPFAATQLLLIAAEAVNLEASWAIVEPTCFYLLPAVHTTACYVLPRLLSRAPNMPVAAPRPQTYTTERSSVLPMAVYERAPNPRNHKKTEPPRINFALLSLLNWVHGSLIELKHREVLKFAADIVCVRHMPKLRHPLLPLRLRLRKAHQQKNRSLNEEAPLRRIAALVDQMLAVSLTQ